MSNPVALVSISNVVMRFSKLLSDSGGRMVVSLESFLIVRFWMSGSDDR